ncbi:MAG: hydroxymethylglutaryl-CoA lyase [Pseudomonadota bacterium]
MGNGSTFPSRVTVIEVGPRDGLQMEKTFIPTAEKVAVINEMLEAGLREIEVTSFVSPRAVPQLADADEVLAGINRPESAEFTALVPNAKGAERAAATKLDAMITVLSASETHNQKNVNRSVEDSLKGCEAIVEIAGRAGIAVHGAIATSFGCPFEGEIGVDRIVTIAKRYAELGIMRVGLGDTTGMATPRLVRERVRALQDALPEMSITLHFHNTRGVGLVNVMAGLEEGIIRYDSSIAGLGGCPFAAGATGNICTEDLVFMLDEGGIETGIDLERLIEVANHVQDIIGRSLPGQLMKAGPRLRAHQAEAVATAHG